MANNITKDSIISYDLSTAFMTWLNTKILDKDPYKAIEGYFLTYPKHPELKRRTTMFLRLDTSKRMSDDTASDILFHIMAYVGISAEDLEMDDVTLGIDEDLDGRVVLQIGLPSELAQSHFGVPKEYELPN